MKKASFFIIAFVIIINASEKKQNAPPFSVKALQWLLERKEYDRFDWFIGCYIKHHPDTAILYLLKGYRYFEEAINTPLKSAEQTISRTGGIPRKYPDYLVIQNKSLVTGIKSIYNKKILDMAFTAMNQARTIKPEREDIYMGICQMAAQSGRLDIFLKEIKIILNRFGYTPKLKKLIFDYINEYGDKSMDSISVLMLSDVIKQFPGEIKSYLLLSKYFYLSGNLDSAYSYSIQALKHNSKDLSLYKNAIMLASLKCDFNTAKKLSLKRYELSKELIDLEQATIFAYAANRFKGIILYNKVLKTKDYSDSLSITKQLFNRSFPKEKDGMYTYLFSGNLFYLNFPLFYIYYRSNDDQITYYHHKAGAYYSFGLYDSAAYYNLKLVKMLREDKSIGYSAVYNLAAEYYASGRYLLSYQLFLWIYQYFSGWYDTAVRYALAMNYEHFGDFYNARKQYIYIIKCNKSSEKEKKLKELALYRLKNIKKKKQIIFK